MMRTHTHSTKTPSANKTAPGWKIIDAQGKRLGRVAGQAALSLQGKHNSRYVANIESGDHVVIINAAQITVSGRKGLQKTYSRFSGYPGGLRKDTFDDLLSRKPTEVLRHAVSGMLPKNKLRDRRLARLHIYADAQHPYAHHFAA